MYPRCSAFMGPLLLAALVPLPAAAQTPAVLEVQLSSFRFTPNPILLEAGRPLVLRLVNDGKGGHDFTAATFFAAAAVAPADRAWIRNGSVEVPGRQVRELRLTAPSPGTYKLKCTHTLHKAFGMSGEIIVR
jgi:uncharacterized cupredoxin-like copper-binding protein